MEKKEESNQYKTKIINKNTQLDTLHKTKQKNKNQALI